MSQQRPVVGIDLGTTYSAAAYIHKGRPEIIESPTGERIIPSVVHMNQEGQIIVGRDARAALVAMPSRTVAAIKRKMGSSQKEMLAGKELLPQEISALILKELKGYVDARLGPGEKEAVITVPAYFNDEQRRATKQAGELAGFIVERIINEPTAAAMAYGLYNLQEDRNILVYDLGGGTFDVSVLEAMGGILEVKASSGNSRLGGEDFDWLLAGWMAEIISKKYGVDPLTDLKARAILKEEAERVKIALSEEEKVAVSLPVVMFKKNKPIGLTKEISRSQFEDMINSLLLETLAKVKEVLNQADLKAAEIQDVLLVGGSTRIPRVQELMYGLFQKEPRKNIHPDEVVALGAAVQAGIKSGTLSKGDMIVTDVAPFSMGIAVLKGSQNMLLKPGGFAVIIPKNTTIPVTRSEKYYTTYDDQGAVHIEVYQGEHEWVKYNQPLGEFLLEGVPLGKAGDEAVEVRFHYNLNGILEVTAICLSNQKSMQVNMQDALSRFTPEAFQESAASLEALWKNVDKQLQLDMEDWLEEDIFNEEKDFEELKKEAGTLLKRAKKMLAAASLLQKAKLQKAVDLLQEALAAEEADGLIKAMDEATDLLIDAEL